MSPDQELQVLFPAIEINGITVKPFKFKDFRSVSLEEIGELEGDKAMDLFIAVFEINSDFFIQKLTEGAEKIAARLAPKGGLSKSPDSFAPDTDSRTLENTAKPR